MKNTLQFLMIGTLLLPICMQAATLQVGPGKQYATPCAALAVAADGDIILVDPVLYKGDVCAFSQNNLTIKGVDGRAHIDADGKIAQQKGIWVPYGRNLTVENMEFSGAAISAENGNNGAGIRASGTNWTVINCYFHDNQDGILESNIADSNIVIEFSEFARNGAGDGQSHNLYIGHSNSLVFQFNYSHDANVGHLLKTRSAINYILYNRLTGENGTESYETDVPNGGTTYFIGNLIQQGPTTQNSGMLTYMLEGRNAANPGSDLYVINNSFVNQRPNGGIFVSIGSQDTVPALIQNNIFYGPGTQSSQVNSVLESNFAGDPNFVNVSHYDYRLKPGSPAIGAATSTGLSSEGYPLRPMFEYVHPACGEFRLTASDIGAYAFHNDGFKVSCSGF
jgi:hypothetical protein